MNYECERCGMIYPETVVTKWGQTKETNGKGPRACCCALVENPNAPPARDSDGRVVNDPVFELCGGSLQRTGVAPTAVGKWDTPIAEGRTV
jgi:hypothetical protein